MNEAFVLIIAAGIVTCLIGLILIKMGEDDADMTDEKFDQLNEDE